MKRFLHSRFYKKKVFLFYSLLFIFAGNVEKSFAQPANDDICSASALPTDGTCLTGQTNFNATSDYYGGCIQPEISRFGTVLLSQHQMII